MCLNEPDVSARKKCISTLHECACACKEASSFMSMDAVHAADLCKLCETQNKIQRYLENGAKAITCRTGTSLPKKNVLDDTFKTRTAECISTVQTNAGYNPDAKCPLLLQYLLSTLGENELPII